MGQIGDDTVCFMKQTVVSPLSYMSNTGPGNKEDCWHEFTKNIVVENLR